MRSFYKSKIDVPNADTMTDSKRVSTDNSIVEFLSNLGESSASLYLEKRLSPVNIYSKESEKIERERNEEIQKISLINSGILKTMERMEKSLNKGQDTSVQSIPKKEKPALEQVREIHYTSPESGGSGWFSSLLGSLLGGGMLSFLMGFKELGPLKFAMKLVEMGWGAIKDKVKTLVTSVAKGIMAPMKELLDWIMDKLSKIPGFEDFKRGPKPGAKPDAKPDAKPGAKPDAKAKVSPNDVNKMAGVAKQEAAEAAAKQAGKGAGKSLLKKIPLVGLVAAGGFAIDKLLDGDAVGAGMEITSGILGTLGAVTFGAGTAGSVAMDVAIIARDVERMNEAFITKLDDEGIIDKSWFGETTVEDWDAVRNMSSDELKALAEHKDLNSDDKMRVETIMYKKQLEQVKLPADPTAFNESGVKVVFNDKELLADSLLESNDKLQEFLLNNPFTDENSIKTEKEIDGKKVVEIKYKDEELNNEYINLKMKYDEDFAKYKESREAMLRGLNGSQTLDGHVFSEAEVDRYKNTSMTKDDFLNSLLLNSARKDVTNAITGDLSKIDLPTGELAERIKKHEGLRLQVYKDTMGYDTIGYGHKLKAGEDYLRAGITKEQAEELFAQDFKYHADAAAKIPGFANHPKQVQDALIDMTYNMGPGWHKTWPSTMKMLADGDYKGVANSILSSKYATQVKGRALTNAKAFDVASDTQLASNNVNPPVDKTPEKVTNNNINKLDKDNAVEAKSAQVNNVENTSNSLIASNNQRNVINNISNNNVNQSNSHKPEPVPLAAVFGTYV